MVKNYFAYIILIVLVAIAAWFFIDKASKSKIADTNNLINPTPTVTSLPKIVDQNNEWIKLENGLEYQDLEIGAGGREAKNGDKVFAHYTGILKDGTKFDSSYNRGEPFSFTLGGGEVIKGWDIGLLGMKVGGKRKLIIPPKLGYGNRNIGNGLIPSNSTLYFDVELMNIQ